MIRILSAEVLKLKGSLAAAFTVTVPMLVGLLVLLSVTTAKTVPSWPSIIEGFVLPIWSLFLLPMAVATFAALIAQIEHRSRGWDQLLSMPVPRWRIFAAKAFIVLAATVGMTVLVLVGAIAATALGSLITTRTVGGSIPFRTLVEAIGLISSASACFAMLQLWVALRFASFVAPLATGIAGTLVSLAAAMTGSDKVNWFPWVMPGRVLSSPYADQLGIAGVAGGGVVILCMIYNLNTRPMR